MQMKFCVKNLVEFVKWKDVKRAIKFHYPTDKNNYEKLFNSLGKMPKVKTKPGEMLEIYGGLDIENEYYKDQKNLDKTLADFKTGMESLYYGIHIKDNSEFGSSSMSFVKWAYLANLPVCPDTLKHYTFVDIIAHFIWEITYYGEEKQIKQLAKELSKRVKEIEKNG